MLGDIRDYEGAKDLCRQLNDMLLKKPRKIKNEKVREEVIRRIQLYEVRQVPDVHTRETGPKVYDDEKADTACVYRKVRRRKNGSNKGTV